MAARLPPARVEAHVLQYGKLLRHPGGAVAPSQEHQLTSKSQGAPGELDAVCRPDFWLPDCDIPMAVVPEAADGVVYGLRYWTDRRQRAWTLLARFRGTPESGATNVGRSFFQLKMLAIPTETAKQSWSLVADAIPCLRFANDLIEEAESLRFRRPTLWVEPSELARDYTVRARGTDLADDDASEQLALHLQGRRLQDAQLQPGTSRRQFLERMGKRTTAEVAWALALLSYKQSMVPEPFIINMRRSAIDDAQLAEYRYLFAQE